MTTRHRRGVRQGRPRPGRPVQGLGRACRLATPARELVRRPARPSATRSRSSTRRCATAPSSRASRSPSRTSCASPSSSTGSASHWIEGGYPQANPKDEEFFRRAPHRAAARDRRRWWRSAPPAARRQGRRRPHPRRRSSRPARRRCASWARAGTTTSPRRSAPRSTRAWPWWPSSVAFLKARRPAGVLRRRALLRRLQGQPRVRPARARGGRHQRRRLRRAVRHQRRLAAPRGRSASSARSSPTSAADRQLGIHTQNDSGCARGQLRGRRASAGPRSVQGTVNGYGERTGNANLMTCHPEPRRSKMGVACLPEGRLERLTAVSHHVAELVNLPPHPADPYVGPVGVRPQGRAAHLGARSSAGGATYEHIDPSSVGNGTRVRGVRPRRPGRHVDEGQGARRRARRPGRRRRSSSELKQPRGRGLSCSRRPTRSLELLMRRAAGWEQRFFTRRGATGSPTYHREGRRSRAAGRDRHRGHGEGVGRRRAPDRRRRGQRPGQRPRRRRCAAPSTRRFPALDRIHLTDFKVRVLDGVAATGAVVRVLLDSTDGERAWTTIGVASNIIEASWQALVDSLVFGLLHAG